MNLRNLKQELVEARKNQLSKIKSNQDWDETTKACREWEALANIGELSGSGTLFGVPIPTETADPGPLREWREAWGSGEMDLERLIMAHRLALKAIAAALGEKEARP